MTNAFGASVALTGGTIPAHQSCVITVTVVGTLPGNLENHTGPVTSSNAPAGAEGVATLAVSSFLATPTLVTKAFTPQNIAVGEPSLMTITFLNTDISTVITELHFTDNYPTPLHMVNAPGGVILANTCGGTLTANPNETSVALDHGMIAANGWCTVKIQVVGTSAGTSENHTGPITTGNTPTVADASGTLTVTAGGAATDLTLNKSHVGTFSQGQIGAVYTLTANNIGAAVTSGTVTVTDTLPASLTATAMSGTGWTCTLATTSCTRSDPLANGSYPAITLTVNVAANAPASVTNTASVSAAGRPTPANNTANDPDDHQSERWKRPDLTMTKTHTGNFTQGQTGATYTLDGDQRRHGARPAGR